MGSTLNRIFRVTTYGESHGEAVGCVVENCPAGLPLSEAEIQPWLDRRRPGQSNVTTPRKESDTVKILSGVSDGKTIGSPIAMVVFNENAKEKDYSNFQHIYRPSHADYTYDARYGHRAHRGGGRASARTTVGVVAAGAIAQKILQLKHKLEIVAWVSRVHNISYQPEAPISDIQTFQQKIESNPIRVPDSDVAEKMNRIIQDARQSGDSLGGTIDLLVRGVPAGWGDPVFDRLDALLAFAMMAIPATKGVEIGSGFQAAHMKGSEHNDIFYSEDGKIRTRTNYSGGIQGGISNGEDITMRVAFKPTATLSREQPTVDNQGNETTLAVRGRHDPCVLPRAVPIVEAMAALVLVDQMLLARLARFDQL